LDQDIRASIGAVANAKDNDDDNPCRRRAVAEAMAVVEREERAWADGDVCPPDAAVAAMMAARNADAILRFIIRLCSIWYGTHSVQDSDHREVDGK
jgi:hypothetical protein